MPLAFEDPKEKRQNESEAGYENPPDVTPRREGGDDALAETNPLDSRADERIIVNEPKEELSDNSASQSGLHSSQIENNDQNVL